jgi:2,3-bisphosphoglycerate-dependent phosphoglycerate mutase
VKKIILMHRIGFNGHLTRFALRRTVGSIQNESKYHFSSTESGGKSPFKEVKEAIGKPKKKILPINRTPRGQAASKIKLIVDDPVSTKVEESSDDASTHMMHFVRGGTPYDPVPPPFKLSNYGDNSLYTLVLLRHGESEWNSQNRYTGWVDVNLTEKGRQEARAAGRILKENNIQLDHVFTSVLRRANFTTNMCLNTAEQHWLPVTKSWRLNERHYGALQGYNKDTAYSELGLDQELVMEMRRSYDTRPPTMQNDHLYWHGNDRRYKDLSPEQLEASRAESLKDTADRILPFYNTHVISSLRAGNKCLIVSHANTIRTLIKHIDKISDEDIKGMTIPTGIPLLYRLDKNMRPVDPNIELEFRYMVEPKGYTWATAQQLGFHGVYLGDLERLQEIQMKRDATNRDWQRIILRNIAKQVQENASVQSTINNGVLETRQLYFQLDQKMKSKQFGNMLLLVRMKKYLENLMLSRKQMYLTMEAYEGILNKLHLDAEGHVVEPFVSMSCDSVREQRSKEWDEMIMQDLEDECLIK